MFSSFPFKRRRRAAVVATVIVAVALTWLARRQAEPDVEGFMNPTHTVSSNDGTTIAFSKLGSGPAVVIVDGAFCYRESGPALALAGVLAEHFTVYAYDRRGRGQSGNAGSYSVEREVDDLRAVVSEAGGSATVIGISSGAALALEAVAAGVGIERLVLYEPPLIEQGGQPRSYAGARPSCRDSSSPTIAQVPHATSSVMSWECRGHSSI
jgi:pimeloyl-ACP methyl ester carboxylesterase